MENLKQHSSLLENLRQQRELKYSDEPGNYDSETLKQILNEYLSMDSPSQDCVREDFLTILLNKEKMNRKELEGEWEKSEAKYFTKTEYRHFVISRQLRLKQNDFLRQIIGYEYPIGGLATNNYSIKKEYKDILKNVLRELENWEPVFKARASRRSAILEEGRKLREMQNERLRILCGK